MIQPFSGSSVPPLEERELVRQLQVTRLLFEEMGGSLPHDHIMTKQLATALDVACGAGSWVLDVAQTSPHLQVTGIDSSEPCIAYAQRLANESNLVNAHFLTQDMHTLERGPCEPASFDLVNVAFIAPLLLTTDYEALMRSLVRLCRPGGVIRWTEMELPMTNGAAFERLMALTCRALQTAGHTFTPPSMQETETIIAAWRRERGLPVQPVERRSLGITPMMGSWLRLVGCRTVEAVPTAIEVSRTCSPGWPRKSSGTASVASASCSRSTATQRIEPEQRSCSVCSSVCLSNLMFC
jgi:ubiquinone/menaquinone biosynthesis C-methylase UbiE